jgi:hypothetical protein
MRYLLTEPMTHKEQLEVLSKVRGWGGAVSFHPKGKVVIYSQKPVYNLVKLAFPNCYIESEGPLPLDTTLYRFQITFVPDRYAEDCEVRRIAAHG